VPEGGAHGRRGRTGGRLVMPVDVVVPAGRAYFLVRPKSRSARPGVDAFRAWIRAEMAAMS
jgi:DNA-binding transcriptional LysR family regulator